MQPAPSWAQSGKQNDPWERRSGPPLFRKNRGGEEQAHEETSYLMRNKVVQKYVYISRVD